MTPDSPRIPDQPVRSSLYGVVDGTVAVDKTPWKLATRAVYWPVRQAVNHPVGQVVFGDAMRREVARG